MHLISLQTAGEDHGFLSHSSSALVWGPLFKKTVPSLPFDKLHYNVFPFMGNCAENTICVSLIKAIHEVRLAEVSAMKVCLRHDAALSTCTACHSTVPPYDHI